MATSHRETGRSNQRHRTRKDLLAATARLLKRGETPDMDQVAAEAMVSRATAYRYFPTIESLLIEAPLDGEIPDPQEIFRDDASTDPIVRLDKAESRLHAMSHRNEVQLRLMLAASIERGARGGSDGIPLRQNRRTPLIEAALVPARKRFSDAVHKKLCASLALIFGAESMIVFRDVLGMDEKSARRVKAWAIRALVNAAMEETNQRSA